MMRAFAFVCVALPLAAVGFGCQPTHPTMATQGAAVTSTSVPGIQEVATKLAQQIEPASTGEKLKVGVVPFVDTTGHLRKLGQALTERVTTELVKKRAFIIVPYAKSEEMDRVLAELKNQSQMSSSEARLLEPSTVKAAGSFWGVDALLISKLTEGGPSVLVDCRLYDVKTGRIVDGAAADADVDRRLADDSIAEVTKAQPAAPQPDLQKMKETESHRSWKALLSAISASPRPLSPQDVAKYIGAPDNIRTFNGHDDYQLFGDALFGSIIWEYNTPGGQGIVVFMDGGLYKIHVPPEFARAGR